MGSLVRWVNVVCCRFLYRNHFLTGTISQLRLLVAVVLTKKSVKEYLKMALIVETHIYRLSATRL